MKFHITAAALLGLAAPAFAEGEPTGDAASGEAAFKQCQTCHVVADADGNVLAGRKAKTGPNLYGVMGGPAASVEKFRYGKSIVAAGEAGLVWDEANFVAYVQDSTGFLKTYLEDDKARSKMTWKVKTEEEAVNLYAYLVSLAPES